MQIAISSKRAEWTQECGAIVAGCGLLILGSYLRVPTHPVPFTMQTCALWIIALTMKPKQALSAVLLYLGLATVGVPVFGGHANPLWLMGKCGGYLVGFPLAVYLVASFKGKYASIAALLGGHCIIYALGFLGLVPLIGAYAALVKGVLIFLPSDLLKTVIAQLYKEKVHGRIC